MGIRALSGLVPEWYTPVGQDDDPSPTRFQFRPLNGRELGMVSDHIKLEDGRLLIAAEGIERCLAMALQDWENFEDDSGPIRFSRQAMDLIPVRVRRELASKIVTRSYLSEDDRKN